MESLQLINAGWLSLVPPLLALALALGTKEVYSSLLVGVFSGTIIYEFMLNGVGWDQFVQAFTLLPQIMADQIGNNAALLLFLALLGALVMVIASAGGSRAYGEWVAKHIKSRRTALLLTSLLGIIIFVDDYFNCLTVGAVMRPVTDRFHISHEKLAWVIDSTAAPVCIIAPVSSWAVAVGGYIGDGGFSTFVQSIPYNLYALLTVFFVFYVCALNRDYGPMYKAQVEYEKGRILDQVEKNAAESAAAAVGGHSRVAFDPRVEVAQHAVDAKMNAAKSMYADRNAAEEELAQSLDESSPSATEFDKSHRLKHMLKDEADLQAAANDTVDQYHSLEKTDKGTIWDLLIPILVLIFASIWGMLYVGDFFSGNVDFGTAVGTDSITGLCIGACVAMAVTVLMFLPRKLLTLKQYVEGVSDGARSMVGAIMILVLAWSLGGVCRYMLGTGVFVSTSLESAGVAMVWLPLVIFLVAAFISFAMGTSWGTIALMLPMVLGIFAPDNSLYLVAIGATLAGAVYGDHVSPISDTTILSSTGASCNHLRHVSTQLPYATTVMIVCAICYVLLSFTDNPWISLAVGAAILAVIVPVLMRRTAKQNGANEAAA